MSTRNPTFYIESGKVVLPDGVAVRDATEIEQALYAELMSMRRGKCHKGRVIDGIVLMAEGEVLAWADTREEAKRRDLCVFDHSLGQTA